MIVEERGRKLIKKKSFVHTGPAPAPTEFICTSRSITDPLILQHGKRWERRERVWANFIPLFVGKQANLKYETRYFTVTWINITVRNGLETFFSSHHFKTRTAFFFATGLDLRRCTPDCSGGHPRWAPLRPAVHVPGRPVSLAGRFFILPFDSAALIRTDTHLGIQVTWTAAPCPTSTARSQCPPCSLMGGTPMALSPTCISSSWDHGLCTLLWRKPKDIPTSHDVNANSTHFVCPAL